MKQIIYLFLLSITAAVFAVSCGTTETKQSQTIFFEALAPRNLSEGSFELKATASSGLFIGFSSSDPAIASVQGSTATLLKGGQVTITASQTGNDEFYEAPNISRLLVINEDNNPNKKTQIITFDLDVTEWKSSYGSLVLEAVASSGLSVIFYSSNPDIAPVVGNTLILNDGVYENAPVVITASQAGNNEYNAAENVSRSLLLTHDTH
jgi:hypothetical protein